MYECEHGWLSMRASQDWLSLWNFRNPPREELTRASILFAPLLKRQEVVLSRCGGAWGRSGSHSCLG